MSMCGEIENLERERDKLEEELFAVSRKIFDIEEKIATLKRPDDLINDPIKNLDTATNLR